MAREEIFFGINIDTGEVIKDFGTLKKRTKELKKELDGTKVGTKRFNELKQEITANQATIRRFNRSLRDTKSLATRVGQGMTNAFKKVGGVIAGAFAARAVFDFFKEASQTIANFEQQLAKVRAVTGATNTEFKALSKSAKELGASSQFTATEVGQLQEEFAKLGFSTSEILAATEATLDLATATQSDLAQAATVAAATVKGFGLTAEDTQEVTDVMAASFTQSALDINKFQTAMATVAPVAKNAGVSLQQTTAILGRLSDAGIDASTSGTALRNIYLKLAENGMTFDEAMKSINNSTNKNARALELFGTRGATVATIIAENTDNIKDFTNALNNSEGAAKDMANIVGDTLTGDVKRLESAWEGLILSFEEGNSVIKDTTVFLTGLLTELTDIREFNKDLEAVDFSFSFFSSQEEQETAGNLVSRLRQMRDIITKLSSEGDLEGLNNLIALQSAELKALNEGGKDYLDTTGKNIEAFKNLRLVIQNEANIALEELKTKTDNVVVSNKELKQSIIEIQEAQDTFDDSGEFYFLGTDLFDIENARSSAQDVFDITEEVVNNQRQKAEEQIEIQRRLRAFELETTNARLEAQSQLLQGTLSILSRDEEARKKNAKLIKAVAIADVIVNTQRALQNIWASASSPLSIDNLLSGGLAIPTKIALLSAGAIAQGAASAALIATQKFQRGGILQGKSHAEGGVPIMANGGMVEAEGGEAIINKKSTAAFAPLLSAINSYGGYGDKFERGGLLGVPSTSPVGDTTNAQLLGALNNINFQPTVSVIEINEAQTRINELNTSSQL